VKNAFLIGKQIYLRPFDVEDAAVACAWLNDPEVRVHIRRDWPLTLAAEQGFIQQMSQSTQDVVLVIVLRSEGKPIGLCGLHKIDSRNRHAEFGIAIGDKSHWGQGHGSEATKLLIDYAFDTLNLNRVHLQVYEDNPRALRCYEKLGFVREGRLRQEDFRRGKYRDLIIMALLREDRL
jgi:diamine N-acetyltransferase